MEQLFAEYVETVRLIELRLQCLREEAKQLQGEAFLRNVREQATLQDEVATMEYALRGMARYLPGREGKRGES